MPQTVLGLPLPDPTPAHLAGPPVPGLAVVEAEVIEPPPPSPVPRADYRDVPEAEVIDDGDSGRRPPRRVSRSGRDDDEDDDDYASGLTALGIVLICFGAILTLFFTMVYDTSVTTIYGDRVHNLGLMQDRLIGVLVGLGLLVGGIIAVSIDRSRR